MATKASINYINGTVISAKDVTIAQKNCKFYCATPNCKVKMNLVDSGNVKAAFFRSENHAHHISSKCTKSSITFNESKYDETRFNLNHAFVTILGLKGKQAQYRRNAGTAGTNHSVVGGNKHLPISRLPSLYKMCISKGKSSFYNGYSINKILVDDENYEYYRYNNNLSGFKLVETSYFHIHYDESKNSYEMIMNYPSDNIGKNSWIKLIFTDKKLYFDYYKKFKDTTHVEPIIIAGKWDKTDKNDKCFSFCKITRSSQIYIVKEKLK